MKRILSIIALSCWFLVATAPAASAVDLLIPLDTVVHAEEGSLTLLATVETPPARIGASCTVHARAQNQESVHLGNDLIVRTGESQTVLEDVEGSAGKVTMAEGAVTLGTTIDVSLLMGPDEVFSAGMVLEYRCVAVIDIVKTAGNGQFYGSDGVAAFTLVVTNPGPVDLFEVAVTDEDAARVDPDSDCPRDIGDLAVGESIRYECTVTGLDGASVFENEACASGVDAYGTQASDCSIAVLAPPPTTTTTAAPTTTSTTAAPTTAAPTTAPPSSAVAAQEETLPATGGEQARLAIAGMIAVLLGVGLLSATAWLAGEERRPS